MIKFLEKHKIISTIFLILISLEIYFFSEIPSTTSTGGTSITSIIYHFVAFFLFNTFLFTTFKKEKTKGSYIIIVLIISVTYGILDEFHQTFTPGRDAGIKDIFINSLGILSSMIFCLISTKSNKVYPPRSLFSEGEYENEDVLQSAQQ